MGINMLFERNIDFSVEFSASSLIEARNKIFLVKLLNCTVATDD